MRGRGGGTKAVMTFFGVVLVIAACGSGSAETTTTTSSTVPATVLDPESTTTTTLAPATTTTTTAPAQVASLLMIKVQQQLAVLGFFDGATDGILGPITAAALEAFQSDAGITADGRWGPETEGALAAAIVENEEFVTDIQEKLAEAGFYSGPEDGDYGSGTRAAVEELQEQCELDVTGTFTALTHVCLDDLLQG